MDLKWSPKTAEAAKKYLDILLALDGCTIKHTSMTGREGRTSPLRGLVLRAMVARTPTPSRLGMKARRS
jgi:hypothetical protein